MVFYTKAMVFVLAFLLCTGFCFALEKAQKDKILAIELGNHEGQLYFERAFVMDGAFLDSLSTGNYQGKILSFEGKTLFQFWFDFPSSIETGEGRKLEPINQKKLLQLPYFENAERIIVFDKEQNQILNFSIGFLAKTCGNEKCESNESYFDCPSDCPKPIGIGDYNELSMSIKQFKKLGEEMGSVFSIINFVSNIGQTAQTNWIFAFAAVIAIVLLFLAIIIYRKKR